MVRVPEETHRCSEEWAEGVMFPLALAQNIEDVLRVVDCDDVPLVSDVTYVDDLCLTVSAEKPDELIERTAEMNRVCRPALGQAWLADELLQGQNQVHHEALWP